MAGSSPRRGVLIGIGVLLIVVGVAGAVALWIIGGDRRQDAVANLARAPVGCDTTLDFVETGEYLVYVERVGRLEEIRGDCDVTGAYDTGSRVPEVEVSVVDPDGEPVDLRSTSDGVEYDEGGFAGVARFSLDVADANDHVVRVESADDETFAIAIGRDPDDGVAALRLGAFVAGFLGVLLGLGAILLGVRRPRTSPAPPWPVAPQGQPVGFTPGRVPQGPPVYGREHGPPPAPPNPVRSPSTGAPSATPSTRPNSAPPPPPPPRPRAPTPPPGPPRIPGEPVWGAAPPPPPTPPDAGDRAEPAEWAPRPSDDETDNTVPRRRDDLGHQWAAQPDDRPPPPQ